jgi:uncharacterized protein (DUF58 family)
VTIWVTRRFLALLGGIALLLACSPGLAVLLPLALAAAVVLMAALLADAFAGPPLRALSVVREPVGHLSLGRAFDLSYELENRSGQRLRIGILETPLRTLAFDRDEVTVLVPPRGRVGTTRGATPMQRGKDAFAALYVWYENGFGLLRRRARFDARQAFRVFPDLSAVQRYGKLHVRNRAIDAGLRKMRLRGAGSEFESLREFTDGDAFADVDWKATARRGRLMVTQYEVERSQNVMLAIDCGRLMTPGAGASGQRKIDYAVTAALSLVSIARLANDRVGLVAFARTILAASPPRPARSSMARLTDMLYDVEPRFEEADYARALSYLRAHLQKRSLIVLLTDVIDPLSQGALLSELELLARRHLLVCAFMSDTAVSDALEREPRDPLGAYRACVALELQQERRAATTALARAGAIAIDVPAPKLSTALIDEYLRIKQRGLL